VLGDAGVKRPPYETAADATILKRPDWEGLSQLDGDVLLYMVGNPYDDESKTTLEADTLANPLWKTIPAVASGRVHKVDVTTWMGFGGLRSANKVLDDVERFVLPAP
jgi:iron complex transport system substrate-binding protein